jgi:hypothetical protein
VPINPDGLNISSDLAFLQNNATQLKSARFYPQSAVLSDPADVGCLYEVDDDLYYNDGLGNQVRITQSGAVAGTPGSIANLVSPASASYVSVGSTFVFQSAANTSANIDGASIILRNLSANSFGLTLDPPAGMGANFAITFPSLPGSGTKFVSLNSSGTLGASWDVDNSTLEISTNVLQVKDAGITRTKLAALGQDVSSSSGLDSRQSETFSTIPNQSATVTAVGNNHPVFIMMQPDGSPSNGAYIGVTVGSSATCAAWIRLRRGSTEIARWTYALKTTSATGVPFIYLPASLSFLDTSPGTGSVTYTFQYRIIDSTGTPVIEVSEVTTVAFVMG